MRWPAAHAIPAGTDDDVVEETGVLDELPVEVVPPLVVVGLLPFEHAAMPSAPSADSTTKPGRDNHDRRGCTHRHVGRGADVVRS